MATTNVLLVKPVRNLGDEGETVKVKAGFARNYLFPQGIALPLNRSTKRQLEVLAKRREERKARELADMKEIADKITAFTLTVKVKTNEEGKMHGAVTAMEIQKDLQAAGFEVERHAVRLGEPIKALGEYTVPIKLHSELTVDLKLVVDSEIELRKPEKKEKKAKKEEPVEQAVEAEATDEAPSEETEA